MTTDTVPGTPYEDATFLQFLDAHSADGNDITSVWAHCFPAKGHDVLVLVMSGPDAADILATASQAAGLELSQYETLH